jgi:signal transduction histidine kinase
MRRLTIRMRLTLLYGGLFVLAGALLLGVTYLLVKQNLEHQGTGVSVSGHMVSASPGDTASQSAIQLNMPAGTALNSADVRHIQDQLESYQQTTLNSVLTQGAIALVVFGILAFGFGFLLAERVLRPMHQITATARRVSAAALTQRGLHERIALTGPKDEVKELADTFDGMLERLDRSFDSQRRFVANASHELRTPLAINRALVEVAITRPTASDDAKQLGEGLLTVNARHEKLIDGLLTLADSENPVTDRSPVDLATVATHILDQRAGRGLTVRRTLAGAPTNGDPILLERLAQNLVENAIRHNEPGGWLSVDTSTVNGMATLTVANSGPLVAPYDTETIFEPFRRLNGERSRRTDRGFGLGLSIVRAVARAHDGEVTAAAREGGGLIVTARLPMRR